MILGAGRGTSSSVAHDREGSQVTRRDRSPLKFRVGSLEPEPVGTLLNGPSRQRAIASGTKKCELRKVINELCGPGLPMAGEAELGWSTGEFRRMLCDLFSFV